MIDVKTSANSDSQLVCTISVGNRKAGTIGCTELARAASQNPHPIHDPPWRRVLPANHCQEPISQAAKMQYKLHKLKLQNLRCNPR
jgi:hypothetical protein